MSLCKALLLSVWIFAQTALLFGQDDAEQVFSQIYRNGVWGKDHLGQGTSGPGSNPKENMPFIEFLRDFLMDREIHSVVDIGCGDWALAREIHWADREYLGVDVVPELIAKNQTLYASDKIHFQHLDAGKEELPGADLLICKDVLQHLPLLKIFHILSQVKKFKYALFVNGFSADDPLANSDIQTGSYRPLDLAKAPFHLRAQQTSVYSSVQELKQIFLIMNEEPMQKSLRFFVLDYHSSATADIINIFKALGHEVVYWTISPYSKRIFGHDNHPVEIINQETWTHLNREMCNQFHEKYGDFLNQFDGFIVTSFSSFALIYEKLNKPIIIINSARYEIPFTDKKDQWALLDHYLIDGVNRNKIFFIANNRADLNYLKQHTGIESELIPSLCLYTHAKYTGKHSRFVVHNPRNNPLLKKLETASRLIQPCPQNYDSFQTLYDYKGIIHLPYQISLMSLFEQYSANIPLFFPSKDFLYFLRKKNPSAILNEVSFFWMFKAQMPPTDLGNLNNMNDPNVLKFWVDSADFYDVENMPYIQYFQSFTHLKKLLRSVDTQQISKKMQEHNAKREKRVFEQWKQVLEKVANA
jgi:hypothetical protein